MSKTKGDTVTAKPARGRRPQSRDLRAAKDALYREHILEVAEEIFAEQGYSQAKMKDIASAAGISLGTLYQSYPGKAELYRGLLIARDTEMFNTAMARGQQVLQGLESIEQLLWMTQAHVRFLLDNPNYLRMQLQEGYAWYHSAARPSSDEQQLWERGIEVIVYTFNWGQQKGLFVIGDPEDQARLMMAMQQTRLANWVIGDMQAPHEEVVAHVQADFVRNFCLPSVAAKLLTEDGARLNEATLERIKEIEQQE